MGVPRFFVSVTYHRGEDGSFLPVIPEFGPCQQLEGGACQIRIKNWRHRVTGPSHLLAVVRCRTHRAYFTLYPPGHVPYGREPFVELASHGTPIEKGRDPPFRHTYFDAALDAAAGIAWPKSSEEGSLQPRFITQCRRLERCCLMLGLSKQAKPKYREKVVEQLGVGGLILEAARPQLLCGGYRASGQAICQILGALRETEPTFQRLASCGHYASIWPQIERWDGCRYRRSGFGN